MVLRVVVRREIFGSARPAGSTDLARTDHLSREDLAVRWHVVAHSVAAEHADGDIRCDDAGCLERSVAAMWRATCLCGAEVRRGDRRLKSARLRRATSPNRRIISHSPGDAAR